MERVVSTGLAFLLLLSPLSSGAITDDMSAMSELTVQINSSARYGSMPRGAQGIEFLSLTLSASCDSDVTIHSIDVKHVGMGAARDIKRVYLHNGLRRIGRSRSFDARSSVATLQFGSGIKIAACDAENFTVRADIDPNAAVGGEHGIIIDTANDVQSTAAHTILDDTTPPIHVEAKPKNAGIINVRFLPLTGRLRYNTLVTAARIQFSADNVSPQLLRSITLKNNGTARNNDLQYLRLESSDGTARTYMAPRMDTSTVTLRFNPPFRIDRNDSVVLLLKGETRGGRNRTVDFTLEDPSDLEATPAVR
jgi:hypothetical protein